jgi:hypothetical protein
MTEVIKVKWIEEQLSTLEQDRPRTRYEKDLLTVQVETLKSLLRHAPRYEISERNSASE